MRAGDRARRFATWLLLGASLAGALLFVGLRLATPSDGGRIAFYEGAWTTTGVLISPIDPPQPDLVTGDRVETIAGRSMEAWAGAVLDPGAQRPAGSPLAVRRRPRGHAGDDRRELGSARDRLDARGRVERDPVLGGDRRGCRARVRPAPGRARGHRARHRGGRRCREQRAVVPGDHDERPRPRHAVPVPRAADRDPVHADVARRRPPGARLPGAVAGARPPAVGDPNGLSRRARRLRRSPWPQRASRARRSSTGSGPGRASSSPSWSRAC